MFWIMLPISQTLITISCGKTHENSLPFIEVVLIKTKQ